MEKEFTTLYDTFGTPINEGDTVEYFHHCYANNGVYQEEKGSAVVSKLPKGFIDRAKENGYTAEYKYHNMYDGDCIQMMKPCVGVVKWNSQFVTYEPVINSQDDFNNNCFHYVINRFKKDEGYCKVIKSVI